MALRGAAGAKPEESLCIFAHRMGAKREFYSEPSSVKSVGTMRADLPLVVGAAQLGAFLRQER